jgi:hypothetical protein
MENEYHSLLANGIWEWTTFSKSRKAPHVDVSGCSKPRGMWQVRLYATRQG